MRALLTRPLAVAVFAVVLGITGCRGVVLNAEYSRLLDQTAALSAESATRAEQGKLTEDQKTQILRYEAQVWQRFRDARDGISGDDERPVASAAERE